MAEPASGNGPARAARLEVNGLGHRFAAVQALAQVSFAAEAGRITCLLGPSGCGKTTLLRLVAGLERVQQGRIRIGEETVADPRGQVPPERRGVGLVFQDHALFPHLSVLDNVLFGLSRRTDRLDRAMQTLGRVRMARHAHAFPHVLSGGEQQRVALARALAPGPDVLLLDEPFSSLDSRLRDEVRDEILQVLKAADCTTLIVTHDSEEAMFMADRIVLMQAGTVVQSGTPHELYCAPATPFVADFFSHINRFDGVVSRGGVETPLGRVTADGLAEGSVVEVAVRPEGVRIVGEAGGDGVPAVVRNARLLGRSSLLQLACAGPAGTVQLQVRTPGVVTPCPGTRLSVRLDPAQTFVFPASG